MKLWSSVLTLTLFLIAPAALACDPDCEPGLHSSECEAEQKKSDEPQRVPDSSRSVNSDVFNYIY